jgi:hypothetical protein
MGLELIFNNILLSPYQGIILQFNLRYIIIIIVLIISLSKDNNS